MSLVRYNTTDSLEPIDNNNNLNPNNSNNKSLSVVYKNNVSNEVVLYDPTSNDFRIVQLKNYIRNRRSGEDTFRGRRRQRSIHLTEPDFSSYDGNNGNQTKMRRHRRKSSINDDTFVCSVCGSFNYFHTKDPKDGDYESEDDSTFDALNNFTSTDGSDNFIRGDYFKLLTHSMNKTNRHSDPLLTDGKMKDDDGYNFQTIPENLINQGYFDKFFRVLSKLGSGSFGSVYKVEHELLGLNLGVFALKKIAIGDDINNLKKILSEVKFLYDLSCNFSDNNSNNNVVKYNHVWVEIDQVSTFGPKIPVVFLLFEYCDGGTLEEWVDNITKPQPTLLQEKLWRKLKSKGSAHTPRYLNNFEIFKIFNDITQGLNYLHNLKILHRDLKPSNCLFKNKFDDDYNNHVINNVKDLDVIPTLLVSDFGESVMVNSIDESWQNNIETTGNTGTLEFCAPEIILQRKRLHPRLNKFGGFSYASDVYSLGMILYYLCFGKLPFSTSKYDPDEISNEILSFGLFKDLNKIRPIVETLHDEDGEDGLLRDWIELIDKMVSKNPDDRPQTSEILNKLMIIYDRLNTSSGLIQLANVIEDDESDQEYIYKSEEDDHPVNFSDVDSLNVIEKEGLFTTISTGPSMLTVALAIANTILLNMLNNLYSLGKTSPILINLQFLMLGLYFGGSKNAWIPIIELVFTSFAIMTYLYAIL